MFQILSSERLRGPAKAALLGPLPPRGRCSAGPRWPAWRANPEASSHLPVRRPRGQTWALNRVCLFPPAAAPNISGLK